jgi:putative thioredoxin
LIGGNAVGGLEQFLEMLRRDRGYQDGLPRKALIDAFRVVEDADLVGTYRRKMASLLF